MKPSSATEAGASDSTSKKKSSIHFRACEEWIPELFWIWSTLVSSISCKAIGLPPKNDNFHFHTSATQLILTAPRRMFNQVSRRKNSTFLACLPKEILMKPSSSTSWSRRPCTSNFWCPDVLHRFCRRQQRWIQLRRARWNPLWAINKTRYSGKSCWNLFKSGPSSNSWWRLYHHWIWTSRRVICCMYKWYIIYI